MSSYRAIARNPVTKKLEVVLSLDEHAIKWADGTITRPQYDPINPIDAYDAGCTEGAKEERDRIYEALTTKIKRLRKKLAKKKSQDRVDNVDLHDLIQE